MEALTTGAALALTDSSAPLEPARCLLRCPSLLTGGCSGKLINLWLFNYLIVWGNRLSLGAEQRRGDAMLVLG